MLVEQAANNGYPMAEAQLGVGILMVMIILNQIGKKAFYWLDKAYKAVYYTINRSV